MNVLNGTSPETVKADVLRFLDWKLQAYRREACNSKTMRRTYAAKTAADAIQDIIDSIRDSVLMPLDQPAPK